MWLSRTYKFCILLTSKVLGKSVNSVRRNVGATSQEGRVEGMMSLVGKSWSCTQDFQRAPERHGFEANAMAASGS